MRRLINKITLTALVLAGATVSAADRERPLAVGEEAPDFSLGDHQGQPFRLSAAAGQRDFVVLAFYVKAVTGG